MVLTFTVVMWGGLVVVEERTGDRAGAYVCVVYRKTTAYWLTWDNE